MARSAASVGQFFAVAQVRTRDVIGTSPRLSSELSVLLVVLVCVCV